MAPFNLLTVEVSERAVGDDECVKTAKNPNSGAVICTAGLSDHVYRV